MNTQKKISTRTLVLGALLTAIIIVLQLMASYIKLGPFSITWALIPIVIGSAICGTAMGAWLGFVFGLVVLLSGDAALFLGWNALGTIITVLFKGIACGFCTGLTYRFLSKYNRSLAAISSAIVSPIVNTGVFFFGCLVFFWGNLSAEAGAGNNVMLYIIIAYIGWNFVVEFIINLVLSPVIVRILNIKKIQ